MADDEPTTTDDVFEPRFADPVEGEPSSHETCGTDPAGQVAETFPGTSTDPQAATKGK